MFEMMQKKMDSVLSQIGTNRVETENKMGVHVQEVLNDHREIDEKKCNMMFSTYLRVPMILRNSKRSLLMSIRM